MPPPEYQKPKLQKHDLSETPKLWRLVQAGRGARVSGQNVLPF